MMVQFTNILFQVKTMYDTISSKDYNALLNINTINDVLQKLKFPKERGGRSLETQTVRCYISSFKRFLNFLNLSEIDSSINPNDLIRLSERLTQLSKGLKKHCMKEMHHRRSATQKKIPTIEDIIKYLNSDFREKNFQLIRQNFNPSLSEIVSFTGVILIELSLDNANRSGEIRSLSTEEYNKEESDLVHIINHKTFWKNGESSLSVNPNIKPLLRYYEQHIRPSLVNESSPTILSHYQRKKILFVVATLLYAESMGENRSEVRRWPNTLQENQCYYSSLTLSTSETKVGHQNEPFFGNCLQVLFH